MDKRGCGKPGRRPGRERRGTGRGPLAECPEGKRGRAGVLGFRVWFQTKGKAIARGKARAGNGGSGVRSVNEGIEGADVPGLALDQREAIAWWRGKSGERGFGGSVPDQGKGNSEGKSKSREQGETGKWEEWEKGEERGQRGYH